MENKVWKLRQLVVIALTISFFLFFAFVPEISIFVASISLLFYKFVTFKIEKPLIYILTAFFLVNVLLSIRQNSFTPLLIGTFPVIFLYFYSKFINYSAAAIGIGFGSLMILAISIFQAFGFFNNYTWSTYSSEASISSKDSVYILKAIDKLNASVSYNLGFQGPSVLEAKVTLRSSKNININLGFIYWINDAIRKDQICSVKTVWTECKLKIFLGSRYNVVLGFGGYGSWNATSPNIEVKNIIVKIANEPTLWEKLNNLRFVRVLGLSFNSNAFGSQMALTALLVLIFIQRPYVFLVAAFPIACLLLTGSRGGLAAFLFGCLVLFIARSRFYRSLPWFLGFILIGLIFLQGFIGKDVKSPVRSDTQTELRSLNFADQDSARGRFEIWRLVIDLWVKDPRTFLIGTGDLRSAMRAEVENSSTRYALNKDELTHAHNLWVQTLGESGLIGACVLLWLWTWVTLKAWRSRDSGALALLAAIFVINLADYLLLYAPVYLAFWMATTGLKPTDIISLSITQQLKEVKNCEHS